MMCLTGLNMSALADCLATALLSVCCYVQSRDSKSLVLINNCVRCLGVLRRST